MVIGGQSDSPGSIIDNTEVYDSDMGSWVISGAKLPQSMNGVKATNIDGRVLIFGILISYLTYILQELRHRYRDVFFSC